jgi:hypothetical protein
MACGPGTPARGGSGAPRGGPCRSKVDPRLLPPTSEPRLGNRLGNRLGRGSLGGVWARDIPLYRRAVPGQRHGDSPASCWFKPCARRWPSEASRQDQRQPRPADPLLAKSDRAGSPPGQTTNRAGHGGREIVRGCPLATARVRCEWHGSGTAGEVDPHGLVPLAPDWDASWGSGPPRPGTGSAGRARQGRSRPLTRAGGEPRTRPLLTPSPEVVGAKARRPAVSWYRWSPLVPVGIR